MFVINKLTELQHCCLLEPFQFISNFSTNLSTLYKQAIESDVK